MINDRGLDTKIEVDGRISPLNIETYGKEVIVPENKFPF